MKHFETTISEISKTGMILNPEMDICQSDYPLDWYQEEFIPYAEEYQALPDRKPATVINWMQPYIQKAQRHFGPSLLLLAHYYMGGEIVKLIEHFGGEIGDSYQLALKARNNPEKKVIIESAVHFMAESIAILARPDQKVFITNPKSGCTMEMFAKDYMVEPAFAALNDRYGAESIVPVCYMNTSGRIKALTGEGGGAVCTSSNVQKIFQWALQQDKKIFFIPDQHMGENVASWVGIPPEKIVHWPGGHESLQFQIDELDEKHKTQFDQSNLILFGSSCSVHTYYRPEMVEYFQNLGFQVVVHPECRKVVVDKADACGSTAFIWDYVTKDRGQTKRYAVGTENHMVQNLRETCAALGIEVVNVGEAPIAGKQGMGCGCATMSRNDPPHLVALLDLLRLGKAPDINEVKPGDVVDETTGRRERFLPQGQEWLKDNAQKALTRMIEITESK